MQSGSERPDFEPRPLDYIEFLNWTTCSLSGGGTAFAFLSIFEGDLSAASVEQAWHVLCLRHPMLGATIRGTTSTLHFTPLDTFPKPQIQTTSSSSIVEQLLASVGDLEFPLGAPLFQPFALLNPSSGRHAFLTVINHAGGDGDAVLKLHKEFAELVVEMGTTAATHLPMNRTLPPSWCEALSPNRSPLRFFSSGLIELTRRIYCDFVPFENYAPFKQRKTRHLIAIMDSAATRSIIERASKHHGMAAFACASLLQVQFAHMDELGLVDEHAKLVLTLPINLRRFAEPNSSISMGTFPHFSSVPFERNMPLPLASQRVRAAIDRVTRPDFARSRIINWHSPHFTQRGLQRLLNSRYHFGPYTTHLGRHDLIKTDKLHCVASFGYLQMQHCFNSLQASTRIVNNRLVVTMNYCEPIISHTTALKLFRGYLRQMGAGSCEVTDNYDEYVRLALKA